MQFIFFIFNSLIQFKSLGLVRLFLMIMKEVSYAHRGCINLIMNTIKKSNIVKYYCNLKIYFIC